MKKNEITRLKSWMVKELKKIEIDEQTVDIDSFDWNLSYNELKNQFIETYLSEKKAANKLKQKDYQEQLNAEEQKLAYDNTKEEEKKEIEKIKEMQTTPTLDKIYWELRTKIRTFIRSKRRIMIVIGDQGIGKSHQTLYEVSKLTNKIEINRGVSTPAGLNDFLGRYSNDYILILDDNEGWIEDLKAISIIKAGGEKPYTVFWNTKDRRVEYKSWKNNSKWIIIMNYKPKKPIWKPIFSRSYMTEIKLSYTDKIKLLWEVSKIKKIPAEIPQFIQDQTDPSVTHLDIRTLEKGYEFYQANPKSWRRLLLTELKKDRRLSFILQMIEEEIPKTEQIKKFHQEGFGSQATFYRISQIITK